MREKQRLGGASPPAPAVTEQLRQNLPLSPVHAKTQFQPRAPRRRPLPPILCALLLVLASVLGLLPLYLRFARAAPPVLLAELSTGETEPAMPRLPEAAAETPVVEQTAAPPAEEPPLTGVGRTSAAAVAPEPDMGQPGAPVGVLRLESGAGHAPVLQPGASVGWVQTAYQDYRHGKLEQAERGYRHALAIRASRRHALLGLAAIAQRRGKIAQARSFYRRVLDQWPADVIARAALLNLQESGSAELWEEWEAGSHAHHFLYFAQGNLYAARQRWEQAAKSYQRALQGDRTHPDYLFNLALSLEHTGASDRALEFYRQAVTQSAKRLAGFDAAVAVARIRALEQSQ